MLNKNHTNIWVPIMPFDLFFPETSTELVSSSILWPPLDVILHWVAETIDSIIPLHPHVILHEAAVSIFSKRDGWYGRLTFNTSEKQINVYDFFRNELPKFGWKKLSEISSDTSILNYQNQSRLALIQIKENLISQLTSPVKWTQSVEKMIKDGGNNFIEIGPGKVLQGLVRKINNDVEASSISS